jgi:hypothetical protein
VIFANDSLMMFKLSNLLRHLLRNLGPDIITFEHYLSRSIISMHADLYGEHEGIQRDLQKDNSSRVRPEVSGKKKYMTVPSTVIQQQYQI